MKYAGLALVGLALGLGLGLFYAWVVSPVAYVDTEPRLLSAAHQADYVRLVARAYAVDGDLERARARLARLGEADLAARVAALAQQTAASGGAPLEVQSLASLAAALGAGPASATPATQAAQATPNPVPTAAEPTFTPPPTITRIPTITPVVLPTRSPTPTPAGAFNFIGRQVVCDPRLEEPLIQVMTLDASGGPVPGIEVIVEWDGGLDRFFTGLKPELDRGYGDFAMAEGLNYTVHLVASPAATVGDLTIQLCTDDAGRPYPGSWQLVFRQP